MDRTFLILLEETRLARERAEEAGGRLEDFCNRSTGVSRFTQDGIRGKGRHSDPTAREVIGRLTLEQNYSAAVAGLLKYKARLERDIEADPFPDMKRVLYWRIMDGLPEIVPEEAETVRYIYRSYLEGRAPSHIARDLTERGILSPAGKPKWHVGTVTSILTNEKYKGDAILQKTFCTDFLTKKFKINEGEVPQYYVQHSHPAIIDQDTFAAVQDEIQRRAATGRRRFTSHCFSGKVFCGECGGPYGSDSCRHEITWRCNARHRLRTQCTTPTLRDQTLRDAFVLAFNRVIDNKAGIIDVCLGIMAERCDTSGIDREIAGLKAEVEYVSGLMEQQIAANARTVQDQGEYKRQYDEHERRYIDLSNRLAALEAKSAALRAKQEGIERYIDILRKNDRISTFDPALCLNTVERITVCPEGLLRFDFLGGQVVEG